MMTMEAALAYGEKIGVRYYVKSTRGGLYGGFIYREDAEEFLKKCEEEDKTNPWTKGSTKFYIAEK